MFKKITEWFKKKETLLEDGFEDTKVIKKDNNEEEALRLEQEKIKQEEALRLEQEKIKQEEALRLEQEKIKQEEASRLEQEKIKQEEALKLEQESKPQGFFEKLVEGLDKTRNDMTSKLNKMFAGFKSIDEELFEELEEILVTADVGIDTTMSIVDNLENTVKEKGINNPEEVKNLLKNEIKNIMDIEGLDNKLNVDASPSIILVVGVNGVGKTTTIGKLSNNLRKEGKKVLIAAGDTFRAAAIEQLEEWGNRANVDIISQSEGSDPAAVIYDGIQAAKSRKIDVLICDTAGRLHNKKNLMNELNKIFRVVDNEYPEAKKEILLVLDATTGQNALNQAKTFKDVASITGIALTKLDGTAKGGVVIPLQSEMKIPVKLIGIGEQIDDLHEFNKDDFVEALFK